MTHWPLLLEPEHLVDALETPGLIIVDLSHPENYLNAHVPGAIHVMPSETQFGMPPGPGNLPPPSRLSALVAKLDLTPDKQVVVYDDEGGGWAGRFIWLLDCLGHSRYSLLNGGLIAWVNEGYPCEQGHSHAHDEDRSPRIEVQQSASVTTEELIGLVQQKKVLVWDARSPEEYRGERLVAARGGHIPGAVNFEWTQAMDPSHNYRLKPLAKLKEVLARIGVDGSLPIITHCQTHHRSGLTYFIGKALGYDIKGYPGSWSEWGNRTDTPIENETRAG